MKIHYLRHTAVSEDSNHQVEPPVIFETEEQALTALERETADAVFLCIHPPALLADFRLPQSFWQFDLIHAGLDDAGTFKPFQTLWLTNANWLFLDPDPRQPSTSWKATLGFAWLRPEALRKLGGFDPAYTSPQARFADFGYRLLMAGGRVQHFPAWQQFADSMRQADELPLVDMFVFIHRHLGPGLAIYAALWESFRSPLKAWQAFAKARFRVKRYPRPLPTLVAEQDFRLLGPERRQRVASVTAIIPTINRYEYLPQAIESLFSQTPAPEEIIVVDQTPQAQRQPKIYESYGERVRVIYLDQAGQSIARNTALREAKGEWCLLFEDDTVAWDGMAESLIFVAEHSGAAVVSGLVLAPWKTVDHIPSSIRHYRLSDVLATGICLAHKENLLAVGGLDRAFDRGSGADHDLGARLYLSGTEIVFNPRAIATHYKAPKGGMRTHGAWWRNYARVWDVYPPPTQAYIIQKYYSAPYRLPLYLLSYVRARKQLPFREFIWLWINLPWKLLGAIKKASQLQEGYLSPEESVNQYENPYHLQ